MERNQANAETARVLAVPAPPRCRGFRDRADSSEISAYLASNGPPLDDAIFAGRSVTRISEINRIARARCFGGSCSRSSQIWRDRAMTDQRYAASGSIATGDHRPPPWPDQYMFIRGVDDTACPPSIPNARPSDVTTLRKFKKEKEEEGPDQLWQGNHPVGRV